jgi:membrane protein implicated in regulation of membrane protease activity
MQAQGCSTSLLRAALGLTAGAAAGVSLAALWSLWAEVEAFGLAGALVALVVWRLAYRRTRGIG